MCGMANTTGHCEEVGYKDDEIQRCRNEVNRLMVVAYKSQKRERILREALVKVARLKVDEDKYNSEFDDYAGGLEQGYSDAQEIAEAALSACDGVKP